ncbi:MAG: hypothetical protein FWF79_06690, partial [Defluviitaleaceae bacterium]|nr:hypothetical protein [Defluviitaleaceae bacterium]
KTPFGHLRVAFSVMLCRRELADVPLCGVRASSLNEKIGGTATQSGFSEVPFIQGDFRYAV